MFSLTCQAPPKTPINLGLLLGLTNTLGAMSNYELHEACNRQGHYQSHSPLRKVIDAASKNMMVEGSSATPPHKATLTKSHPLGTSSATLSQSPSTTRVGAVVQKKTQPTPGPPHVCAGSQGLKGAGGSTVSGLVGASQAWAGAGGSRGVPPCILGQHREQGPPG